MPTSSGSLILAIKLTQQQKTTERDRKAPLECSVFTLRKIEDSSLRRKNDSQEEGDWVWDTVANMLKWWGKGYISATGLYVLHQLYELYEVCKAADPSRWEWKVQIAQSLLPKCDLRNGVGSSVLSLPATPLGGLFSVSALEKCWDSALYPPTLLKRGWKNPSKQCENSFWCDKNSKYVFLTTEDSKLWRA